MYADFEYYLTKYFGVSIDEADFPRFSVRASEYIDYITQGKAKRLHDLQEVKMCCCALAEQYQAIDAVRALALRSLSSSSDGAAEVQSETVGSWSRSYRSGGDSAQAAAQAAASGEAALYQIAQRFLGRVGLLYRGGGRCGHVSSYDNGL